MDLTSEKLIAALAQVLAPALKDVRYKVEATGTPVLPYTHGPGGLFGVAGLDRDVISTRLSGRGLASVLSAFPSNYTNPLFPYITGFNDVSGTLPDGPCDDPQQAGAMKSCIQTAPFGRYMLKTREAEINRVGQLINRGEFDDLRLLNDPLAAEFGKTIFPKMSGNAQLSAGAELLSRMIGLGVGFSNWIGRTLYTGTPVNNTDGGYAEFMGLDTLIGTNKVDAITGQDCPSLYSDIKDMNYSCIDDETADPDIVEVLVTLWRYVNHIATQSQLDPVRYALVMRTGLWWELTDYWPCRYLTYRCRSRDTAWIDPVPQVDSAEAIRLRDRMRAGSYLLIDGVEVPVIIDDYITEESSADTNKLPVGCFASDIYLVPLTIVGGTPATYWQFYDYRNGPMQAVVQGRAVNLFWTDGGMYLWTFDTKNFCIVHEAKLEPRVILKTPHIAGRIENVCYCPLQHPRDVHPDDDYFVDGGVTLRDPPSLYEDWKAARAQ